MDYFELNHETWSGTLLRKLGYSRVWQDAGSRSHYRHLES